ncbi:HAD family hydrolase [Arsenicicoccus sp. oral taxon 190]|uniref:HAD family hydrolase n=1 Tax=Arsenicicoccus sp. oral taxon 190 TaxID=1658671 RepID=UPI00067A02D6|nr:HAD family hydrolase [Arsenicicoccus sp. oral taxon 190]AKT51998.1 haloacid dehalogenase [Arsenicicoccus sp. oral taxon 190]
MADLRPGVLFDVDGTLLDTNYLHALAWWRALRATGHDTITMQQCHAAIGIASEGLVRHLTGGQDEEAVERHSEEYEPLKRDLTAFPRAADLLQACDDAGLAVVLATSGQESDLEWMVPAIGVPESLLAGATTSGDVDEAKPEPDLLSVAVERHGLDPQRTVVVGDTVWDVEAARKAGLPIVAVTCGGICRQQLEEAGADAVYDDPADLLAHLDSSLLGQAARG